METYRPTSEDIGKLYDDLGALYATLWEGDIHVGVWLGEEDGSSLTEAQDRLTDMFIERTGVGPGDRVLDVGCGTGKPAVRLAERTGCGVTGITVSRWQVEAADAYARERSLEDRVCFRLADAMDLPFGSGSFDAVWALESILHMPDRSRVLREIARVLKPGGPLVLADVVNEAPLTEEERALFYPALGVSSLIRIADYPEVLRKAGLEVLEVLDLSRHIEPTIAHTLERMETKREALLRFYPPEFVAGLSGAWEAIARIHASKMGYVLVAGRKPA